MTRQDGTARERRSVLRSVRGLVKACHPGPCVTVTGLAVALGWALQLSPARLTVLGAAVLTGQLSIGWLNDLLDRSNDVAAARTDKPLATGEVSEPTVRRATLLAALACVPLSLSLGWSAGLVHLLAVASGWAYDLRLKRTVWSWLPYVISFGALPAVVFLSLPGAPRPPWWGCAAGALLGLGAHAANALPDIEADRSQGVGGLPARLGERASRRLAAGALAAATGVLVVAPPGPAGPWGWVAAVATLVLLAAGLGRRWPEGSRAPFVLVAAVAVVDVALLVARAGAWVPTG
ncbi:MAG TPA: UbiA family prenyltransferase [Candidatus Limnocylindria bacterium]|nr:UbiA family prenyltransferase [Candidatus Limnocylindria bacterium]